jgi:flagellar motor switch protein FliN/FliY
MAEEKTDGKDAQMPEPSKHEAKPANFEQFASGGAASTPAAASGIDLLMDVSLDVSIELGRTIMSIKDVLALGVGSVIELDKMVGDPVDILVNNKLIAKGEVVVVDENFGVRITSIVSTAEREKTLE